MAKPWLKTEMRRFTDAELHRVMSLPSVRLALTRRTLQRSQDKEQRSLEQRGDSILGILLHSNASKPIAGLRIPPGTRELEVIHFRGAAQDKKQKVQLFAGELAKHLGLRVTHSSMELQ